MGERWGPYTIVPDHEIRFLQGMLAACPPGAVAVAGSFRGGDVMALMAVAPGRSYVVVDSFRGLAEPTPDIDGTRHPRGDFDVGGVGRYLGNFDRAGCRRPDEVREMFIGPDTLRAVPAGPYALVWLDLDHHAPTLDCIRHFRPLLAPGGLIATHDHGTESCPGIARACDDSGLAWSRVPGMTVAFTRKD